MVAGLEVDGYGGVGEVLQVDGQHLLEGGAQQRNSSILLAQRMCLQGNRCGTGRGLGICAATPGSHITQSGVASLDSTTE